MALAVAAWDDWNCCHLPWPPSTGCEFLLAFVDLRLEVFIVTGNVPPTAGIAVVAAMGATVWVGVGGSGTTVEGATGWVGVRGSGTTIEGSSWAGLSARAGVWVRVGIAVGVGVRIAVEVEVLLYTAGIRWADDRWQRCGGELGLSKVMLSWPWLWVLMKRGLNVSGNGISWLILDDAEGNRENGKEGNEDGSGEEGGSGDGGL
jgi:hypothetical protein